MAYQSSAKCHALPFKVEAYEPAGVKMCLGIREEDEKAVVDLSFVPSAFETQASSADQSPSSPPLGSLPEASHCPSSPSRLLGPATESLIPPEGPFPISSKVGSQIWQTTISFLGKLKAEFPGASSDSVFSVIASLSSLQMSASAMALCSLSLLTHGLHISTAVDLTPVEVAPSAPSLSVVPIERKRHLKAKSRYYGKFGRSRRNSKKAKSSGKVRAKTGRKPQAHECFLCHTVCPYKVDLIEHLQELHGLHRSQSLLYKRLSQGPESMIRLYSLA